MEMGAPLWHLVPVAEKIWRVTLTDTERATLHRLIGAGQAPARKLMHARILLIADEGWSDRAIAGALEVSLPTIGRVRKRYVAEGLEAALNHRHPRNHKPRRLDGEGEARLIALACTFVNIQGRRPKLTTVVPGSSV